MAQVSQITVKDGGGVSRDVATLTAIAALIGEVQAEPTGNTLLARVKALVDSVGELPDTSPPASTVRDILSSIAALVTALTGNIGIGRDVVEVTPSDSVDLPDGPCRALLLGEAGTVDIITLEGEERTGVPLQAGFNPIGASRVLVGGSATDIWAVY